MDDGVSEQPNESWIQTEAKVRDILKTNLKLDDKKVEIDRAHRGGKTKTGNKKDRQIVVKWRKEKDKEDILKNSKRLKDTNISRDILR